MKLKRHSIYCGSRSNKVFVFVVDGYPAHTMYQCRLLATNFEDLVWFSPGPLPSFRLSNDFDANFISRFQEIEVKDLPLYMNMLTITPAFREMMG